MEPKSVSKIYTLNKTTYINLRWIAILGQFFTVNIVKYVFDFEFDILIVNIVININDKLVLNDRLDEEKTLGIIKKIEKGLITPPEK